jgi:hypothetical protein
MLKFTLIEKENGLVILKQRKKLKEKQIKLKKEFDLL